MKRRNGGFIQIIIILLVIAAIGVFILTKDGSLKNIVNVGNPVPSPINTSNGTKTSAPSASPSYKITSRNGITTYSDNLISFNYSPEWKQTTGETYRGTFVKLQGPNQVLIIYENDVFGHAFDDFKTEPVTVNIQGKEFSAEKFTSLSWGNSFINLNLLENPKINVEFGDAASVGYQGYNQKYEDKVNFDQDIKPILDILQTLKY